MDGTHKFMEIMLRYENILIMFGAWVATGLVGRMFPKLAKHHVGARLQPLAPFLFTAAFSWLPGLIPEASGIGERLMLALVLGWGSGHSHKILQQTVFGSDSRVVEHKTEKLRASQDLPKSSDAS